MKIKLKIYNINIIIDTARFKFSYLVFNNSLGKVCVNTAGIHNPITANKSILEVTSTTFLLNFWVLCFIPPHSILAPNTNKILPIIDPAIDDFTTSNNPCFKAKNEIINSVALQMLHLKSPLF